MAPDVFAKIKTLAVPPGRGLGTSKRARDGPRRVLKFSDASGMAKKALGDFLESQAVDLSSCVSKTFGSWARTIVFKMGTA